MAVADRPRPHESHLCHIRHSLVHVP
ncbi:hypothetical protein CCACVL1_18561 [Corchorus capsularis]|uniref:Uncharacterized protein n=1 Tax=Corchorus capsularis TaxID=210143 RepID=A0A1R3HL10_COCAP|nr:hypothetical protein CCACVL1_18561 [Corchorus capsularis]